MGDGDVKKCSYLRDIIYGRPLLQKDFSQAPAIRHPQIKYLRFIVAGRIYLE